MTDLQALRAVLDLMGDPDASPYAAIKADERLNPEDRERLRRVAAVFRGPPYPVPVARHPTTGEAVLMLTNREGRVLPIRVAYDLHLGAALDGSAHLHTGFRGQWYTARESAEDVRTTLDMLREETVNDP